MSGRTLRSLVVAGLLVLVGCPQAALTVYTSQAAFLAAVTAPGTDTFQDISITGSTPGPLNRSAGAYSYTVNSTLSLFYGAGTSTDHWLSTNTATDTITFNAIPANVRAIGGFFFGSDIGGILLRGTSPLLPRTVAARRHRRSLAPPRRASGASCPTDR